MCRSFGYVQQDVFLFSDSIENNIRFGVDASFTKEDLMLATQTAPASPAEGETNRNPTANVGREGRKRR